LTPRFHIVFYSIAFILFAAATARAQIPNELDSYARARIEQARASIVLVTAENEAGQPVSTAAGFFIRNDLVATDRSVVVSGSRVHANLVGKDGALEVAKRGNYFLPFVEVATRADISPLELGNIDKIAVNDKVYMFASPRGALSAGTVTGTRKENDSPLFLMSLPVNSDNRGEPVFNGKGEVIGIAAESPDGQSQGIAFSSILLGRLKQLGQPLVNPSGGGIGPGLPSLGPGFGDGRLTPGDRGGSTPSAPSVDTRPLLLRSATPRYTEEARKNNVQGQVILRVLVGEDGEVKQVRIVRGLPDGLSEQAIAAARQSKFKPAMKDGKPVAYWMALSIDFNLR